MWWRDAVVYQIYPRSFQDSDADGVGDLPGVLRRLPYVRKLGADAIWLSPFYPSPQHDFGYDIADFRGVDPLFGTLADVDRLLETAHAEGLRVVLDLVPCHSSIEHPWFREHPEHYVLRAGDERPNNWVATFGGPAWSRDPLRRGDGDRGRWYLHSFYPEQPDLDWRKPEVVREMQDVIRFWLARGVDGFRLDALDRLLKDPELRDDPPADGPPPLPEPEPWLSAGLAPVHSRNASDIGTAIAALREAAGGRLLVGEVYLPTSRLGPYREHLDLSFCFELLHARWDAGAVRGAIADAIAPGGPPGGLAWVLSNHDFPRLPDRVGREHVRAAATLLLTLPGAAFVFQGDELGQGDGPGHDPPYDRNGRDAFRHPLPWAPGPGGGFTSGDPWLPVAAPPDGTAAEQERDPDSMLSLYRRLIALRRQLRGGLAFLAAGPDVVAYTRGDRHVVALNLASEERPAPPHGEVLLATHPAPPSGALPPFGAIVARR